MKPSNETSLNVHDEWDTPSMTVTRVNYFIEVDYPDGDNPEPWRSTQKHLTPEDAAQQWIDRDPPSPYPCRIIKHVTTETEQVYGTME